MGKAAGFLEFERKSSRRRPVAERIRDFEEFNIPLGPDERKEQAGRCMNCGVPFCQSAMELKRKVVGCPLHNLIPEWNDQIWLSHDRHGYDRLIKTSNFPEFTGRVCPALCEKACICGQYDDPVSIHDNELYLIEKAFKEGYIQPQIPEIRSGKRVAVIGSGPAGLAAADELNHRGHSVEVFEREDRIGGLLMYGIPNMKLDKSIVERRQKLMEKEGVIFHVNTEIKTKKTAEKLRQDFDAVILCCGSGREREFKAADISRIKGVVYAMDFLKSTQKAVLRHGSLNAEDIAGDPEVISARGKNVVIMGSGDTANDCVATVMRHGCASVFTMARKKCPPSERTDANPWPEYPEILEEGYGYEEAAAVFGEDPRHFETTIRELIADEEGRLCRVITVNVIREDGRYVPVKGSEKEIKCQLLILANGFEGCESKVPEIFGASVNEKGQVSTRNGSYMTDAAGVFSAGDMHRGQSLVVWAIAEGRKCAKEVDEYLMGYTV